MKTPSTWYFDHEQRRMAMKPTEPSKAVIDLKFALSRMLLGWAAKLLQSLPGSPRAWKQSAEDESGYSSVK